MKQLEIDSSTFARGATITSRHLRAMFACEWQIRKFRKEWPDGMKLLKKNLIRAAALGLDVCWLVDQLKSAKLISTSNTLWLRMRHMLDEWETAQDGQMRIAQKAYYKAGSEVLWEAIRNG